MNPQDKMSRQLHKYAKDHQYYEYLEIRNIGPEWEENAFKEQLVLSFCGYFSRLGLHVKLFQDAEIAVVRKLRIDLESLRQYAKITPVRGRLFEFVPDIGEPRNNNGYFQKRFSRENLRDLIYIKNVTDIIVPFPPTFGPPMQFNVPNSIWEKELIYFANTGFNFYTVRALFDYESHGEKVLVFGSVLDTIDCILRCNLNPFMDETVDAWITAQFATSDCSFLFTESYDKCILKFTEWKTAHELQIEHQFVPLERLNFNVLDVSFYRSINVLCTRCKKQYTVVGIDMDLEFLAAMCECKYNDGIATVACNLEGEAFTRLIPIRTVEDCIQWLPVSRNFNISFGPNMNNDDDDDNHTHFPNA